MGKWKECELGDITTLHYGKALRTDRRTDGDIPVFSSAGLTGCHGESLVDSRGLIIGRKGTVGKVYLTDTPFWCIDTAYYILPDDSKYDFKYLYFLLKTLGLEELNEDSAVPRLNRDTAYQQSILLPSISEQKAIASVLSSLDDKIDLLYRQNITLEAMAETFFRQWFVEDAQEDWEEGYLKDKLATAGWEVEFRPADGDALAGDQSAEALSVFITTHIGAAELDAFPNLELGGDQFLLPLIHEAAKRGNLEQLAKQLEKGINVDLSAEGLPPEGMTPLMWAAARGKPETVRYLIDAGASLEAKSSDGLTPLMAAAGSIKTLDGDPLACVIALVEAGADLEATDHEGRTAVFYACGGGEEFDIPPYWAVPPEFRLDNPLGHFGRIRSDVHGPLHVSWSPTHRRLRLRHGDADRLRVLIDAGAKLDVNSHLRNTPLITSASSADAERVRLLLESLAPRQLDPELLAEAFEAAIRNGDAEMFALLLTAVGPEVELRAELLTFAAGSEEAATQKVQALIALGADVNAPASHENAPLFIALQNQDSGETVTLLLEAGADPEMPEQRRTGEETILILSAENGPPSALRWLLKRGYDVNERSRKSPFPTALIVAASSWREDAEKVRVLLEYNADVNAADDKGTTPLLAASHAGNMEAVIVLAESGAEVNVTDPSDESSRFRMTPLMYVAKRSGILIVMDEETGAEAAKVLLEHGADPNLRNADGLTARMLAVKIKNRDVAEAIDNWATSAR